MTLPLRLYRGLANLAAPFLYKRVAARLMVHGVSPDRAAERFGHATQPRPPGPLIWIHAASVGESLSALPLIDRLLSRDPATHVLITSGTASSAKVLRERLPERALHQFAPLDSRKVLTRFLNHWQPKLFILIESELWPQMLLLTTERGTPAALVNARLSPGSLRNWGRMPATARTLLSRLALVTAQTEATADALRALGAPDVRMAGNLKSAAPPPADHAPEREALEKTIGNRPRWLAASTHPGEERLALAAHRALLETWPDLLLVLAPRHPERADSIAREIAAAGLAHTRRSAGEAPTAQVYLADTLGEIGLWLRLCPVTLMGGSLTPNGGHNPWEGAALGTALLTGPNIANCRDDWLTLSAAQGALITSAESLTTDLHSLLADPESARAMAGNARKTHASQSAALDATVEALAALMAPA